MKSAKIIAFIAFIFYGLWVVGSIFVFFNLKQIFQELELEMPFSWPFVTLVIYTIGIFVFWLYLRNKERKGEIFKYALWISIALLLIPLILDFIMRAISFMDPLNLLIENL